MLKDFKISVYELHAHHDTFYTYKVYGDYDDQIAVYQICLDNFGEHLSLPSFHYLYDREDPWRWAADLDVLTNDVLTVWFYDIEDAALFKLAFSEYIKTSLDYNI